MYVCILYIFPFYNSFERLTALLSVYIPEVIYRDQTEKRLGSAIREKNRPRNWYNGFTRSVLNHKSTSGLNRFHEDYEILSSGVSGEISTPYFGQPFNGSQFEYNARYFLYINLPKSKKIRKNPNISLVIEVEFDILDINDEQITISYLTSAYDEVIDSESIYMAGQNTITRYRPLTQDFYKVSFIRNMKEENIKLLEKNNKTTTGMKVRWYYNETVKPWAKYKSDNRNFIVLANILQETEDFDRFRKTLLATRSEFLRSFSWNSGLCEKGTLGKNPIKELMKNITKSLGYDNLPYKAYYNPRPNISDATLSLAEQWFVYLVDCPLSGSDDLKGFFVDLFTNYSLKTIIFFLARIYSTSSHTIEDVWNFQKKPDEDVYRASQILLEKLATKLKVDFSFQDLEIINSKLSESDIEKDDHLKKLYGNFSMESKLWGELYYYICNIL